MIVGIFFVYAASGRLTKDLNKKISGIQYNYLHLPKQVDFTDGRKIEYVYDASGVKLQTKHTKPGESPTTTDYFANRISEDGVLKMIRTEEGYAVPNGSNGFNRYYYIKDHLGNNRVVMNENGGVEQVTNYYPFGTTFAENPARTDQDVQRFKFGGKELDRMFGLDMYDFEARMYSPVLGRFMTMDPMAEKYYSVSPYAYCANNPIRNIDPTGEDYWSTNDPEQIRAFINSLGSGATQHDFSGWQHATDAEFTGNLTYNDESGKFYTSYTTIENGEITVVGKSFEANLTPVSSDGYGYPGAFVYEYENETWSPLFGFAYDITPFSSFISPIDPSRYGPWSVNSSGRITGIAPITGMPPAVGRGGSFRGGKFTEKMGKVKGNMPGNNQVQNKQVDAVSNTLGLTKTQRRQLHDAISGQGYGYQEILQVANDMFR